MYVKQTLINKTLAWIDNIQPKHPRPTFMVAYGKLAALYEIGILSDAEYDRRYDELSAKDAAGRKKGSK